MPTMVCWGYLNVSSELGLWAQLSRRPSAFPRPVAPSWRAGSLVESACSCMGLGFSSQHSHAQPLTSEHSGHCVAHKYLCSQNTHANRKINKSFKVTYFSKNNVILWKCHTFASCTTSCMTTDAEQLLHSLWAFIYLIFRNVCSGDLFMW